MGHRSKLAITIACLTIFACAEEEDLPPPPIPSGGGTDDGGSVDTTAGDDTDSADEGDICDGEQYGCRMFAFAMYRQSQTSIILPAVPGQDQFPQMCVAEDPAFAGSGAATGSVSVCGSPSSMANCPEGILEDCEPLFSELTTSCKAACEMIGNFTASNFGLPTTMEDPQGNTWSFDSVTCFNELVPVPGMPDFFGDTQGFCSWPEPNSLVPAAVAGLGPCTESQCAFAEADCATAYDPENHVGVDSVSGNTSYAHMDASFVDDVIRGHTERLFLCDLARYVYATDVSDDDWFTALGRRSLLTKLGIENGDTNARVWNHNPATYNRIGSVYSLTNSASTFAAMLKVIDMTPGNDMHVTLQVTRNGVAKTIHIDSEQ